MADQPGVGGAAQPAVDGAAAAAGQPPAALPAAAQPAAAQPAAAQPAAAQPAAAQPAAAQPPAAQLAAAQPGVGDVHQAQQLPPAPVSSVDPPPAVLSYTSDHRKWLGRIQDMVDKNDPAIPTAQRAAILLLLTDARRDINVFEGLKDQLAELDVILAKSQEARENGFKTLVAAVIALATAGVNFHFSSGNKTTINVTGTGAAPTSGTTEATTSTDKTTSLIALIAAVGPALVGIYILFGSFQRGRVQKLQRIRVHAEFDRQATFIARDCIRISRALSQPANPPNNMGTSMQELEDEWLSALHRNRELTEYDRAHLRYGFWGDCMLCLCGEALLDCCCCIKDGLYFQEAAEQAMEQKHQETRDAANLRAIQAEAAARAAGAEAARGYRAAAGGRSWRQRFGALVAGEDVNAPPGVMGAAQPGQPGVVQPGQPEVVELAAIGPVFHF
jgi:hypothetical protein